MHCLAMVTGDHDDHIMMAYLIFVIFCTSPHFLACKLYARKVRKFATKNCVATKPHKSILGVPAILVGVLGVLCIGMVYLLHEIEHSELGLVYLVFGIKKNVRISLFIL